MRSLDQHFADYADHHRNALNKATHSFGIPMIAMSLLGLASRVTLFAIDAGPTLDLGIALAAALVATYLVWHVGLALGVAMLCIPLYLIGQAIPTLWLWVTLAVGLVLQYLGHIAFEGNSPAFHRNLVHTLIGPLWMVGLLFQRIGLYRPREGAR
jgi:uncharacterized membrane protein YGL010W